jgi:hypothetical protein
VNGQRELDDAKVAAKVPARLGDCRNDEFANLGGELI